MSYQGDISASQILYFTFTSNSAGVPTTLSGSPALSIYKDDSTSTETTTGITLLVDYDGLTGLNNVKVNTSGSFYAVGHDYSVIITTGTIGGVSAIGYVVGSFSIENRSTIKSIVEGSITFKQALQLLLSIMLGKSSGGATTTVVFRDTEDSVNRITATVDSNGDRSNITLNL